MSGEQRGHMRFVGGTIFCPRRKRRYNLGLDHRIHDKFVCPGCGVKIPGNREALAGDAE